MYTVHISVADPLLKNWIRISGSYLLRYAFLILSKQTQIYGIKKEWQGYLCELWIRIRVTQKDRVRNTGTYILCMYIHPSVTDPVSSGWYRGFLYVTYKQRTSPYVIVFKGINHIPVQNVRRRVADIFTHPGSVPPSLPPSHLTSSTMRVKVIKFLR